MKHRTGTKEIHVETVRSRKTLRAQSARRARPKKRRNGHIRHSERNEREERDAHSTKERANLRTDGFRNSGLPR